MFFAWPMKTAGKTWWYKCCWNCWHDVRGTLSPKVKGTSSVAAGTTSWAGSSFFLHRRNVKRKHNHGKKGSFQENREISRRVAWIAELRASQFQCLENKRYKVDQHPKDPEPEPPSSA